MKRTLGFLLLILFAGCTRVSDRTYRKAPVILISIDTLRADHLPAYGYDRVKTPNIDALARDSVLFENAYSHVPLTLPSHTTLFTGLLPPQTGVRDNAGYTVSPKLETLASLLKGGGYATGGAISSVVLVANSGISRGFDAYDDSIEASTPGESLGKIQRSGYQTEKIAEEWIGGQSAPFFYFLHLYEPHTPYEPAAAFKTLYADRPYDGEIATADDIVGKFVAFLKERKLYDRSVVILLSDHGEGLGDHGEDEHGTLLYREALHVPMLLKLPGSGLAGTREKNPVALFDVLPTLSRLVGVAPPAGLPGAPLLSAGAREARRRIYSETLFPRYHFGWSDLASLTDSQFQYIRAPKEELYDLAADPGETRNLAPGLPNAYRSMRNELLTMSLPRQAPGVSDPEQMKKLASLGYIGSASPSETAMNLPDPKDHIGEITDLKAALALYGERKYEEAVTRMRALLAKNPSMSDAWGALAETFHKLGRNGEALEALRHQDELMPGAPQVMLSFANEYIEMNDLKKARLYAERAITIGSPPEAHEALARVMLAEKDYDGAEREAMIVVQGHRGLKSPYVVLAQVARARGDLPKALALLDQVEAKLSASDQGEMSNLNYYRGDVLARLGRNREAEEAFVKELRYFPANNAASSGLAFLYASEGRADDVRRTLEEMVKAAPTPRSFHAAAEIYRILGDAAEARRWNLRAEQSSRREKPS